MKRFGLFVVATLWLQACGHARAPLPLPEVPFSRTPDPDAAFRRKPPEPLALGSVWQEPRVQRRTLPNGMELMVVEQPGLPVARIRYLNRVAGRFTDPEHPGIARVTASSLLNGTMLPNNQVSTHLTVVGQSPWVSTSLFGTEVGISVFSPATESGIEALARVVRYPVLDTRAVTGAIEHNVRREYENSKTVERAVHGLKIGTLYGWGHLWAMGAPALQEAVRSLEVQQVRSFYTATYQPEHSALVVVGDVAADQVFAWATAQFGGWQGGLARNPVHQPLVSQAQSRMVHAVYSIGDQTTLRVLVPAVEVNHPDFPAFELLREIFVGSSLFKSRAVVALRHQQGSTYGVTGELVRVPGGAYLQIALAVDNDGLTEAVRTLRKEIKRIAAEGVGQGELDRARRACLAALHTGRTGERIELLSSRFLQGLSEGSVREFEERIATLGSEDIRRVVAKYVEPERLDVIAVGNTYATIRSLQRIGRRVDEYYVKTKD